MNLRLLGKTIGDRRKLLGLTQEKLAKLAGLSRRTIQSLEAGALEDLGFERVQRLLSVLGLSLEASTLPRSGKRGLWMAAKNASVSYRGELSEQMLEQALAVGTVEPGFEAHIGHFLDESPVSYVVMAVEETAEHEHLHPSVIWANVARLAQHYAHHRKDFWV